MNAEERRQSAHEYYLSHNEDWKARRAFQVLNDRQGYLDIKRRWYQKHREVQLAKAKIRLHG